jgi:hypothetical protein
MARCLPPPPLPPRCRRSRPDRRSRRAAASQRSTFSAGMFTLIIMPLSGSGAGRLTPMPPRFTTQAPCGWRSRR